MDEKIKQRLLGAAVILILIMMIVPFFRQTREPQLPQIQTSAAPSSTPKVATKEITLPVEKNVASTRVIENTAQPLAVAAVAEMPSSASAPAPDNVTTESTPRVIDKSIDPIQALAARKDMSQKKNPPALPINSPASEKEIKKTNAAESKIKPIGQAIAETSLDAKLKLAKKSVQKNAKSLLALQLEKRHGLGVWSVQVGTFSQTKLAVKLIQQLQKNGLASYQTTIHQPEQKIMYRVRVGHELSRKDAENLRAELQKSYNLKAIIVEDHS